MGEESLQPGRARWEASAPGSSSARSRAKVLAVVWGDPQQGTFSFLWQKQAASASPKVTALGFPLLYKWRMTQGWNKTLQEVVLLVCVLEGRNCTLAAAAPVAGRALQWGGGGESQQLHRPVWAPLPSASSLGV